MKTVALWGLMAVALMVPAGGAAAQQDCTSPGVLGVSRTIKVDTTNGPWFGEPHGDRDFLKPGEVVLTFDDGPAPVSTRPILEALAAQCTKATFFMVGRLAAEHPAMVREVAAAGHTIGTHTWSHANIPRQSYESMVMQIEAAFTAVAKAAGSPTAPFFRYPYLNDSPPAVSYLQGRNVGQFAIDIDSFDWRSRNADSVINRVMAGLTHRGRGIVLLHDIHPSTAVAVPRLLAQLKMRGYKIVHLEPAAPVELIAGIEPPTKEAQRLPLSRQATRKAVKPSTGSGWPWW